MAVVKTQFASDEKEVMAAINKMNAEMEKLIAKNKKLSEDSAKGSKSSAGAMEGLAKGAIAAASGIATASTAMSVLRHETEALYEFQSKAAQAQLSTADAQAKLFRSLGTISADQRKKVFADLNSIAKETGVTQRQLYNSASFAVAASGSNDSTAVTSAIRQAARLAPDNAAEMDATAAGLLDLTSLTGTNDAKKNMGFMLAMGAQTRVTSLDKINANLVPGALGVKGFGGSANEAAGLVDTLTELMKDPTGAVSKTAAINLAKNMEKMFPNIGNSPLENIKAIQNDPAMRTKFLKDAGIEAEAYTPVSQLLTKGSSASEQLMSNIASMPTLDRAGVDADRFISEMKSEQLQRVGELNRQGIATEDRMLIDDLRAGSSSVLRERTLASIGAAEPGYMKSVSRGWQYALPGRSPEEAATTMIQNQLFRERSYVDRYNKLGEGTAEGNAKNLADIGNLENLLKVIAENTAPIKQRGGNANQNVEGQ